MTSLVADYGTSSGSESDDNARSDDADNISKGDDDDDDAEEEEYEEDDGENEDNDEEVATEDANGETKGSANGQIHRNGRVARIKTSTDPKLPLPTPNFTAASRCKTSVFANPFVEAEKAKSAILEKHVKMTPTLDDTKMINGRKICWNYRKGRCRFGHNCTFAHDSDLHRSTAELEAARTPEETIICQTHYANNQTNLSNENEEEHEIDQENNQLQKKRKKRPGLAQNLVPGKKVLKLYKAQQSKTVGR